MQAKESAVDGFELVSPFLRMCFCCSTGTHKSGQAQAFDRASPVGGKLVLWGERLVWEAEKEESPIKLTY